jgi:hypothetical protein
LSFARPRLAARLGALALLTGCAGWEASEQDGLEVLTRRVGTGPDGRATVEVDVDDQDKLLITGVVDDGELGYLGAIEGPDGEALFDAHDWWDEPRSRTNAGFASAVVVASWPMSGDDAPLSPGRWRFDLRGQDPNVGMDVTVLLARDADLSTGTLPVEIVYSADLERDADLRAGVEAATALWRDQIYGPAGLDVTFTERDWDGPARLASPGYGDADLYRDAVADKPLRAVTLLVVRQVDDVTHVLGVAGGIPGPLVPTDRSVVTVSAVEAAGTDLKFSDAEVRLFAETMAHEVGHFLGLFHPVELATDGGDRAARWDALADTPECADLSGDCVDALGTNLMYPTPVCAPGGSGCTLLRQETITADQRAVQQRYVTVE